MWINVNISSQISNVSQLPKERAREQKVPSADKSQLNIFVPQNDCENGTRRTNHPSCAVSARQRSAVGNHRLPDTGACPDVCLRHHHAPLNAAGHHLEAAQCTAKRKDHNKQSTTKFPIIPANIPLHTYLVSRQTKQNTHTHTHIKKYSAWFILSASSTFLFCFELA